jgi:hypothetical protein
LPIALVGKISAANERETLSPHLRPEEVVFLQMLRALDR